MKETFALLRYDIYIELKYDLVFVQQATAKKANKIMKSLYVICFIKWR